MNSDIPINTEFRVRLISPNRYFRNISNILGAIAILGFCIIYFIDLPVRNNLELSIPYYANLPSWILNIFWVSPILLIICLQFLNVNNRINGILLISNHKVEFKSKKLTTLIYFKELKCIAVVMKKFGLRSYLIEFLYPNKKFIKIKILSKIDFAEIIDLLGEIAPEILETEVREFESH